MIHKTHFSKAFGLNIKSEIYLREISEEIDNKSEIDVFIIVRNLSEQWKEENEFNRYFILKENRCMFEVPNVAIYLILDGNTIIVSPHKEAHLDQYKLYILGTCMGAILMQRKILPLHGSAIAIDGKAYAIVGDSGAGKSTLAKSFLNKGYQLLSDDVIPVTLSEDNVPIVTPAYPQQKLWIESLNEFGMDSSHFQPIYQRETKFTVPVNERFQNEALPLAGIFELIKIEDESISILPIRNMDRFHTFYYHTYRNFFLSGMGLMDWHFQTSAKMVNKLPFYQLRRPTTHFTAHELTDLILHTIGQEELV